MHLTTPRITSTAILIGFDPDGRCVYSEILDIHDYYDGEHVWDEAEQIIRLNLRRMKGYLFDSDGVLDQEFESIFDLSTGIYASGHARFADGTVRYDGPVA